MNLDKALAIPGWMSEPDLRWLAEQAASRKFIVEIGSYLGRSTRAMVDNTQGLVLAVDDWYGPRDVVIPDEERRYLMDRFKQNFSDVPVSQLRWLRVDHASMPTKSELLRDFSQLPDMIFIDGDHNYSSVKQDLEWAKEVMEHGLFCGHDRDYPTVRRAVLESLRAFWRAGNFDSSIWYREI